MRRPTVAVLVLVLAACTTSSPVPPASSSAAPLSSEGMPQGQPVRVDLGVEMSPDDRVVTLRFVGGVIVPATNPCHTDYAGWARPADDVLQVAVVLLPDAFEPSTESACAAAGMQRTLKVVLEEPFIGLLAIDVSFGSEIVIERPTPEPSRGGGGA